MKRQTRTTKQIIKAVSVGLSASMLLQPVTAMADGLDENAPVLPDVEEKEEVPYVNAGDESCESENIESLENAKELLDDAEKKEDATEDAAKKLEKEPSYVEEDIVLEIIENLEDNDIKVPQHFWDWQGKDVDDSAKEFDEAAEKHLDDAKEILEEADKALTGDPEAEMEEDKTGILDEFEDEIKSSEDNSHKSVEEAAKAAAAKLTAEAADVSANNATSSDEAKAYGAVAEQAAKDAKINSVSANEDAAAALQDYEDAKELLAKAKEEARKANEAANKALELSLEDAEDAVKLAKAAEEFAEGLEAIVAQKKEIADAAVTAKINEISVVADEITNLTNQINGKNYEHFFADVDYHIAVFELNQKLETLRSAEWGVFYAPKQWDIWVLEGQLAKVEAAMKEARLALTKLGFETGAAYWENEEAKRVYKTAEENYNAIKEIYEQASKNLEDAKESETTLNGSVSDLKAEYGDNIMDLQKNLRTATTDETKADAAKSLIACVMGSENVTYITYEEMPNGIFMVKEEGEDASYYTYEIAEDGTITIKNINAEVSEAVVKNLEAEYEYNLSEEAKNNAIADLQTGEFFVKVKTSETTYEITFKADKRFDSTGYVIVDGEKREVVCREYYESGYYYWWFVLPNGTLEWIGWDLEELVYTTKSYDDEEDAEWWYNMYARFRQEVSMKEITTNTYDVTTNVDSKVVAEEEMQNGEWLYYEKVSDAVEGGYTLTCDEDIPRTPHNRFYYHAPETTTTGKYKYLYTFEDAYGSFSTADGTLYWDPTIKKFGHKGSWVMKDYYGEGRNLVFADYVYKESSRGTIIAHYLSSVTGLTEKEAKEFGYGTVTKVEAQPATYRVYFNKTETTPGSTSYTLGNDALSLSNLAKQLSDITEKIRKEQGIVEANQDTVDAYEKAKADAQAAQNKLNGLYEKLFAANIDYYNSHYESRVQSLKIQIKNAKYARDVAYANLDRAYKSYIKALDKKDKAYAKLLSIEGQISKLEGRRDFANGYKASLEKELTAAKNSAAYWAKKVEKVGALEDKAEEARIAAEKARDALKLLQNTSNVGEEAIKKAEAELALALADYEEADRLAKLATKDAEDAETAYNNILDKIEELLTEEARRRGSDEGGDEGGETTPTTPAPAGNILVAQAGPAVVIPATATATAGAPEDTASEETVDNTTQQTITENLVPMAAAPTEQIINEQDVPLAPMDEQAKMSWWWIIAVLVLGTTGAELLRRRMVKKNAATLESTKTNK